jgi:hypothetical protein
MSVLLPTALALGSAFAVAEPGPEARQIAARVRASLLTHNWTWLCEEEKEYRHKVFKGLAAWCAKAPDFPTAVTRLEAFYEALIQSEEASLYSANPFQDWLEVAWSECTTKASKMPFYFEGKPLDSRDFELPKGRPAIETLYEACLGAEDYSHLTVLTWDAALGQAISYTALRTKLVVNEPVAWFRHREDDAIRFDLRQQILDSLIDEVDPQNLSRMNRSMVQSKVEALKRKILEELHQGDFRAAHETAVDFYKYCVDVLKIRGHEALDSPPWGLEQLLAFSNAFNVETWRNRWAP